jgi:hypothetical protein
MSIYYWNGSYEPPKCDMATRFAFTIIWLLLFIIAAESHQWLAAS